MNPVRKWKRHQQNKNSNTNTNSFVFPFTRLDIQAVNIVLDINSCPDSVSNVHDLMECIKTGFEEKIDKEIEKATSLVHETNKKALAEIISLRDTLAKLMSVNQRLQEATTTMDNDLKNYKEIEKQWHSASKEIKDDVRGLKETMKEKEKELETEKRKSYLTKMTSDNVIFALKNQMHDINKDRENVAEDFRKQINLILEDVEHFKTIANDFEKENNELRQQIKKEIDKTFKKLKHQEEIINELNSKIKENQDSLNEMDKKKQDLEEVVRVNREEVDKLKEHSNQLQQELDKMNEEKEDLETKVEQEIRSRLETEHFNAISLYKKEQEEAHQKEIESMKRKLFDSFDKLSLCLYLFC